VHEHIARTMYYFSIHLLFASVVGCAAWALTSIRGTSATTKYWIWVLTSLNFFVPVGALIDKLWGPHLVWARPFGAIGSPVWELTAGRKAVFLAMSWLSGACLMFLRLLLRLRNDRLHAKAAEYREDSGFLASGIPITFGDRQSAPSVSGVLKPRIMLPSGMDRALSRPEFDAVLIHELVHARRRDNLIRLLHEISLCVLWFHPLVWFAGARMALFRELSCDESVIRNAHGRALVAALAKLAVPAESAFLEATASSHLTHRLAQLTSTAQGARRTMDLLVASVFAAIISAGIFQTIAHTACCFRLAR